MKKGKFIGNAHSVKLKFVNKIVAVVGPTATGKTDLAISLCKKFNGEIISVDSRQAYKEMNIGTGKSFGDGSVPIHLYDLVNPSERLNAHDFAVCAWEKINELQTRKKVPFLVGGTGFYMDVILGRRKLSGVGVNQNLRDGLEELSIPDLIKKLRQLDPSKLAIIDVKNKYRLIRAIEIVTSTSHAEFISASQTLKQVQGDILSLGLTAESKFLYQRADKRVDLMINSGLMDEVKGLVKKYGWKAQGLNALGYREFKPYLEGAAQLNESVQKLKYDTHAYIRRQKTYFKKYFRDACWFDVSKSQFEEEAVNKVNLFLE